MDPSAGTAFLELSAGQIADFARREAAAAAIPETYLPTITENLRVLQGHARLVDAALKERGLGALTEAEAFEP